MKNISIICSLLVLFLTGCNEDDGDFVFDTLWGIEYETFKEQHPDYMKIEILCPSNMTANSETVKMNDSLLIYSYSDYGSADKYTKNDFSIKAAVSCPGYEDWLNRVDTIEVLFTKNLDIKKILYNGEEKENIKTEKNFNTKNKRAIYIKINK